jgi:hypothetical protein
MARDDGPVCYSRYCIPQAGVNLLKGV